MNKSKAFLLIVEIIVTGLMFGCISWIFELIDGNQDIQTWNIVLQGALFGMVYVPVSRWLRKKDKEIERS